MEQLKFDVVLICTFLPHGRVWCEYCQLCSGSDYLFQVLFTPSILLCTLHDLSNPSLTSLLSVIQ